MALSPTATADGLVRARIFERGLTGSDSDCARSLTSALSRRGVAAAASLALITLAARKDELLAQAA